MSQTAPLALATSGLGYASIDATSVRCNEFDPDHFEIVLPTITYDILKERDYDKTILVHEEDDDELGYVGSDEITREQFDADEDLRDKLIEAFEGSDAYSEWRDSFYPVMLYYWPVMLGYRADKQKVADLIDAFAGCVTLIEITDDDLSTQVGEDHALVLTGGGMDLSDRIALAYIACEEVPPISLLEGLGSWQNLDRPETRAAVNNAYAQAAEHLQRKAERLVAKRQELFGAATPELASS